MGEEVLYQKVFPINGGDFDKAGEVSTDIKGILRDAGVDRGIVRRVAIASFEAEMNVVIHASAGVVEFVLTSDSITLTVNDRGPGIEDIELAMQEGWSTASNDMREMGFGAGMGLPNIKKNSDEFEIESEVGTGTKLRILIRLEDSDD
jgi:anti-sigma regulatory factor (Ser/Thr protein kinase)